LRRPFTQGRGGKGAFLEYRHERPDLLERAHGLIDHLSKKLISESNNNHFYNGRSSLSLWLNEIRQNIRQNIREDIGPCEHVD
jgi:hypothetical protein